MHLAFSLDFFGKGLDLAQETRHIEGYHLVKCGSTGFSSSTKSGTEAKVLCLNRCQTQPVPRN